MKTDRFDRLVAFLERLDNAKIPYTLSSQRYEAISVVAYAPGEYWEIDFLADGEIDVERYRSDGKIHDESMLEELFALCSDEEPATPEAVNQDASPSRK
jgi:hypothetical protein